MPPEEDPRPQEDPQQKPNRYRWLLALGLVPVLVLGWVVIGGDEELDSRSESVLKELRSRWPDPRHPEGMDGFLDDARKQACDSGRLCHVLWADSAEFRTGDETHQEMTAVLISLDGEGQTQQTWVEWSDEDGEDKTRVRDPFPFDREAAAVQVRLVSESHYHHAWLFPEGAEGIEEIRYAEGGVVAEELEQPDGDHFEHVRTVPRQWWAKNKSAGTIPLLRYWDGAETVYSVGDSARVCVGELGFDCHTTFPSEEVLVSLRTMWDSQYTFRWQGEDHFLLDDSLEISPDFAGALDEPLSTGTGHVARLSWTVPDPRESDSGEKSAAERVTSYAVYFDDGAPALLSTYRKPSRDSVARAHKTHRANDISGVALFPYPSGRSRFLLPLSFHPAGQRILLSPGLEEVGGDSGYTVYEPLDTEEPPLLAYVAEDVNGAPLETGWLDHGDVKP